MPRSTMLKSISFAVLVAVGSTCLADPEVTTVHELADGVYFRKVRTQPTFIGCNNGWVEFEDFVLVIDANFPNQADEVIKLIRERTKKPIRYVFDTHHHGDHADGNAIFEKIGARAIASERARILFQTLGKEAFEQSKSAKPEEYGPLEYTLPTLWFPEKLVLDDGTMRVEFLYFGHGHTAGDAVAWLPKQGILFTGDACVNGPFNFTGHSDTASWIDVLNQMSKLPVKKIAPGHGEPAGRELIATQRKWFVELRKYVQSGIDAGKSLDDIKAEIDLPFYEEWTGVPATERTENIEHVHRELTAAKKE